MRFSVSARDLDNEGPSRHAHNRNSMIYSRFMPSSPDPSKDHRIIVAGHKKQPDIGSRTRLTGESQPHDLARPSLGPDQ